ncbi:Centromere protein I [Hondaea fermentalgiana]|uniref:Centromere protein I n=1 Tax=Hondaea fermentalgiana TaxID=2315210 RepID=A0A2R5GQX9_9STRA|nr:Centromere protein I [Hondaea fermentalgiana]|eukprot:GBG33287.1 Centromere protein I [Hondaea fermentalgiana]
MEGGEAQEREGAAARSFEEQLDALARKSTAKRTRTARRGARGAKRRRRRTLQAELDDDEGEVDEDEIEDEEVNQERDEYDVEDDYDEDDNDDFLAQGGTDSRTPYSARSAQDLLDEDSARLGISGGSTRSKMSSREDPAERKRGDEDEDEDARNEPEDDSNVVEVLNTLESALDGRQHAQGHAFEEVSMDNLLDDLLGASRKRGLSNAGLQRIIKLASHRKCKKSEVGTLLRCLLPRTPVEAPVVVDLLGLFSSLSLKCKVMTLKWLILVNRKLSRGGTEALHKCYGVLFHYVDYESTRAPLCRLLYMLTRRKDVTVFRAERLGALVSNLIETGQDAGPLLLLSDLYAQYAPDLLGTVPSKFARPRLGFFRSPDEAWGADLKAVSRRAPRKRAKSKESSAPPQTTQKERHPDRSYGMKREARNDKVEELPEALTSRARDDDVNVGEAKLMLAMADFADFMQQTLPELENFCIRYLETWNGAHHTDALLRLVSRLQPRNYEDLRRDVLLPLQRVYQTASVQVKARIISCLHCLMQNWAIIDWETHLDRSSGAPHRPGRKQGGAQHRFVPLPGGVNYYKVLYELIGYTDQLLVQGLVSERDHPLLQVAAADFFGSVARLHAEHGLPFIVPPSPGVVYRMLLAPSCVGVSAMAQVLVDYLQGFTQLREDIRARAQSEADAMQRARQRGFSNGIEKIDIFNAYIWDYCQILWFGKAAPGAAPEPVGSLLFRDAERHGLVRGLERVEVSDTEVGRAFGMMTSAPFAGFAADLAERTGLDHAHQLDPLDLLNHLRKNNCHGLQVFMKTFIAALNN